MKALEFPFTENGFRHELLERDGLVCLVKRSKGGHWHYEVVRLNVQPAGVRFGKWYPERETYPSSEEWGIHAFTYQSHEFKRAVERAEQLKKGVSELVRG